MLLKHTIAMISLIAIIVNGLAVGVLATGPRDLTPLDTLYPPQLSNISYIIDASIGTYGGSYHASVRSANTSLPYGSYDFCSMPHPRASEYVQPAAVVNGSVKAKLVYLEYMQRHQRRTPYGLPPAGENKPFHCDNVQPFLYAGPTSGEAPIPVYAATYTTEQNPFNDELGYYGGGTCQYPQVTVGGVLDGYTHGADIWSVYGDLLDFLPDTPNGKTSFRSSESALTQASAGAVLRGIWPDYKGTLPLHQQISSVDTVNEGYPCDKRAALLAAIQANAEWIAHIAATQKLADDLNYLTMNDTTWTQSFDALTDYFQCRTCNGYALPCNPKNTTQCVTQAQAEEVWRAGDWEWNYWYGPNKTQYTTEYIQTVEGLFLGESVARFEQVMNGTQPQKYVHVFVHDNDIGPILGALGIKSMRWPGMGSNIAFEIWETESLEYFGRVLYSGQPIETIHGTLNWLPLKDLVAIIQPFVPSDIIALCSSSM